MEPETARKSIVVLIAALGVTLAVPAPAHAVNPVTKLVRGAVNTATGWLEIPNQIAKHGDDGTAVMWTVHGFIEGIRVGLQRTLFGLYDVVTFPIPPYDAPLMEPDTLIAPRHGREPETVTPDPATGSAPTTNVTGG